MGSTDAANLSGSCIRALARHVMSARGRRPWRPMSCGRLFQGDEGAAGFRSARNLQQHHLLKWGRRMTGPPSGLFGRLQQVGRNPNPALAPLGRDVEQNGLLFLGLADFKYGPVLVVRGIHDEADFSRIGR
jgi:hypothetical protein